MFVVILQLMRYINYTLALLTESTLCKLQHDNKNTNGISSNKHAHCSHSARITDRLTFVDWPCSSVYIHQRDAGSSP